MYQIKKIIGQTLVASLLLTGCESGSTKFEEVGPRIQEGFYASTLTDAKEVPLVAVLRTNNQMEVHAALSHDCHGTIRSYFTRSAIAFSQSIASIGGPSVRRLDENCDIKTEIIAESAESIQIQVKINGNPEPFYSLRKVTKELFTQDLKEFISISTDFKGDEESCEKALGVSCEALSNNARNQ